MTVKNSHLVKSLTSSQKNQLFADRNEIGFYIGSYATSFSNRFKTGMLLSKIWRLKPRRHRKVKITSMKETQQSSCYKF